MKRQIALLAVLILVLAISIVGNVVVADTESDILAVSDKVTAPNPNWPTPQEQEQGLKALQEMIERNK